MKKLLNGKKIVMGVCYYPEHWKETLWRDDLCRMLETGIEVIRIAEFAWNKFEPREGVFQFDFFDRFLDLCEELGMQVIFCTPTATPPAWLTEKYPEVLNVSIDGVRYRHGTRRHYNYNSKVYREKSAVITEEIARHYAKRSCIIGWQLDNEFNCEKDVFYSESDTLAFREFLKKKYETLEELNEAWGTVFWNQTYTEWEEIFVPRTTYSNSVNPHQVLDYLRFISDSVRSFAKIQSDILRRYLKEGDFLTTNGIFGHLDYHKLTRECLDFITYDSYPNFGYCLESYRETDGYFKDRRWSDHLSKVRSISPTFGIMEQQSGANGWNTRMEAPTPRPGQLTLWTMQSIAHGADFISYFRWRTATMGTEIYWHGILDYSGRENRRLREVREVVKKMACLKEVAGAGYEAKVAILNDYDNQFDSENDVWHKRVEWASKEALFQAAQLTHTPFDYVNLEDETDVEKLLKYEVIFYPHATIMNEKRAQLLEHYVSRGGTLVIACRSGYKDMTGKCVMDYLPGLLAKVTGTDIPEYSLIAPDVKEKKIHWGMDTITANVFTDFLTRTSESAVVEAFYEEGERMGEEELNGALVKNCFGKGIAYYFGTAFNLESAKLFLHRLEVSEPYAKWITLPEGCELAVREKMGKKYLFVLNYEKTPANIWLSKEAIDLFSGNRCRGEIALEGYGAAVYAIEG